MDALVIHAPGDLRVEDVPTPQTEPGQLRIRVRAGGICGSDLHYYQHGGFGTVRIQQPMVLGHEVAGSIEAVGTDAAGFAPGERVAISPSRPCGQCRFCQQGLHNHCLDMRYYGSAMRMPHVQGAFRQRIVCDASQAHKLADHVSDAEGAMAVIAARRAGATHIVVTDMAAQPLRTALKIGADQAIDVKDEPEALRAFSADKGQFDVLFEASGNAQALTGAFDALRPRGIIVQMGLGGVMTLPLNTIVAKEFELRGTFRFHAEFAVAVELLNRRLVDLKPLVSATLPYRDAGRAFALAADRSQAMKVLLSFD